MNDASDLRSGKGHRDENFPVASWLIQPRHRGPILAFYEFVRTADDIADHASLPPDEKLRLLDRLEAGLLGANGDDAEAVRLRAVLAERALSPKHAQDLLAAFRRDVTKLRYRDWDDLMAYCALSAMPVGRFVLDVHGESRSAWPAYDALCAALQIINHLQDCADGLSQSRPRLYSARRARRERGERRSARRAARRAGTARLPAPARRAHRAAPWRQRRFAAAIADTRLGLEVAVIHTLAQRLTRMLALRDPLSERVHLAQLAVAGGTLLARAARRSRSALAGVVQSTTQPRGA